MTNHTNTYRPQPRFFPGQIVATPGAIDSTTANQRAWFLDRHLSGDWGCVCMEDKQSNDYALNHGGRMLSAYALDVSKPCEGFGPNTLWIITEADRSVTTLLLPGEY